MSLQTYQIASPLDTHWRVGTCEEDHCEYYLHGWRSVFDENTELGAQQAAYVRGDRSRKHVETREIVEQPPGEPDVTGVARTVFTFEPGQRCFRQHRVPLGRPELYLVQGDGFRRVHSGPDAWRDDLCTNQERLAELINRG